MVSAVLLLASIAVWIRSYFISDQLIWTTRTPVILGVAYGKGTIDFVRATFEPSLFVETTDSLAMERPKPGWELLRAKPDDRDDWRTVPPEHQMHFLGAKYRSGQVLFMYAQDISLPMWMLVLAFAVWPTNGPAAAVVRCCHSGATKNCSRSRMIGPPSWNPYCFTFSVVVRKLVALRSWLRKL